MELLLNELSLHNQYSSSENFRVTGLREIIQFFQLQKTSCITILKKSDIYSREVYNGITMLSAMTTENLSKSDEIRKLKSDLSKVINDPFWDFSKKCDGAAKYTHNTVNVNDSALAECYERKIFLISFIPSNYSSEIINVEKDKHSQKISNYTNNRALVQKLYEQNLVSFEVFCKNYYNGSKLDFSKINVKNSFDQILDKKDEIQFINSFNMFSSTNWSDILKQSGKGKNIAGFDYKKFHDQDHFAQYSTSSPIYKFRVTQKFRVFGYRIKDSFILLEFDLTHQLSD
ncbi:hypothetical protein P0M11_08940 [Kaistella sp. PBT33-4]|uniref:hypothetical protein n=1 Tax=Kaistella sp. PBT33-4 TaxID=3032000 RepID=UPI0023D8084A|nr:hypothetical protein [Kaistella sp. PBT33-4]MDF0720124.1 hypothetical protein [Kaistella sp. PBT33-4]